jgi:hypothetical protein
MYDSRRANQPAESLTGVVERITFSAENDGYTIARLQVPGSKDLVTIVGNFACLTGRPDIKIAGLLEESPPVWLAVKCNKLSGDQTRYHHGDRKVFR